MKVALTACLALFALGVMLLEGAPPWVFSMAGFVAAMTAMSGRFLSSALLLPHWGIGILAMRSVVNTLSQLWSRQESIRFMGRVPQDSIGITWCFCRCSAHQSVRGREGVHV